MKPVPISFARPAASLDGPTAMMDDDMNAYAKIPPMTRPVHSAPPLPTFDARDLTQEGNQAHILLDDQVYVLRITRAGKLILTK
jgi:hemin uptake protein HemP